MAEIEIKIPALEKLIDVVASGVGAAMAPYLIRKEAEAKADAIKIIANAQTKAKETYKKTGNIQVTGESEIGEAIESKLQFQEEKRFANIKSIVAKTKGKLPAEVSKEKVNDDWTARFFTSGQDVSTEELQEYWASIFAEEIKKPGTVSLRTLDTLKNMSKKDAELFEKISKYIIGNEIIFYEGKRGTIKIMEDISYSNYRYLVEIGLLGDTGALFYSQKHKREVGLFSTYPIGSISN